MFEGEGYEPTCGKAFEAIAEAREEGDRPVRLRQGPVPVPLLWDNDYPSFLEGHRVVASL
jgi:hypothetical protein